MYNYYPIISERLTAYFLQIYSSRRNLSAFRFKYSATPHEQSLSLIQFQVFSPYFLKRNSLQERDSLSFSCSKFISIPFKSTSSRWNVSASCFKYSETYPIDLSFKIPYKPAEPSPKICLSVSSLQVIPHCWAYIRSSNNPLIHRWSGVTNTEQAAGSVSALLLYRNDRPSLQ